MDEQPTPVIAQVFFTSDGSLPIGADLTVPPAQSAVLVHKNQPIYTVSGGSSVKIAASDFPHVAVRRNAQAGPQGSLDIAAYLIHTDEFRVPFETRVVWTNGPRRGLTCRTIRGAARVRIDDPARFFSFLHETIHAEGIEENKAKSFQLSLPKTQAAKYVKENLIPAGSSAIPTILAAVTDGVAQGQNLSSHVPPDAKEMVESGVTEQSQTILAQRGVRLLDLQITEITQLAPFACSRCGTTASPTTEALFRYNVGLFYMRFGGQQQGGFCRACAVKVGLGYTAITATVGWWGLISLCLTPFYISGNLYNTVKALATRPASLDEPPLEKLGAD